MTRRLGHSLLVLLLAVTAGCAAPVDRPGAPAVSGAYLSGSGGWHS